MNKTSQIHKLSRFPIGFWSYTNFEQIGPEAVKDYIDCGMTIVQTPRFRPEEDDVKDMITFLDACHESGLKAIVCDNRCYFWFMESLGGESGFRNSVEQAVKDFGDHPAVLGFHVGDEPNKNCVKEAFLASAIHKEIAPELSPFLNLGPYGPGSCDWVGYEDYGKYLDDYVRIGNPDFLCFDVYWQLLPEENGRELYFGCLKMFTDAAKRHNLPLWITPLSVGHFRYRRPTEDLFRWQVNTAAAHGLKGFVWFFFYMREPHDNYLVPPIDEHWERTETFEWLSRVNRTFLKWHGPVLLNLELQNVYHAGNVWAGYPKLGDNSKFVKNIEGKLPLIISEFKDNQGQDYVSIVNSSQTENDQAIVCWRGKPGLYRAGWLDTETSAYPYVRDEANRRKPADEVMTGPWLAPGQMELYRVETEKV
ncbi:hypothetical protein GF312_17835 [Candidatus Poribacteria bacterium]|nr:hypothetical protein [Candidatus Poribacteria bacterium]